MEIQKGLTTILVVDDEVNVRRSIQVILQNDGYQVHLCDRAMTAYQLLIERPFDLVLLDIRMDEISGIELFEKMRATGIEVPVVFVSGNASLSEAVQAVRMGASDFIEKPFDSDRLLVTVERTLKYEALKRAMAEQKHPAHTRGWIGESDASRKILSDVAKVAPSNTTILIQGESGTGKELIARLIHEQSERRARPFVTVNCSAIPETLIESELFGHEKGAFTGAVAAKRGYFEQANHGTLFLDEIGDMSLGAQAKVLRAIQNSEIQKIGSERVIPVHVRLISATHKNLKKEVKEGRFREDLFFRVSVIPIVTPALRERPDDIALLAGHFIKSACEDNGLKIKEIDPQILEILKHYRWPGNVRELKNLAERLVILSGDKIMVRNLPVDIRTPSGEPQEATTDDLPLKDFKDKAERAYIVNMLRKTKGNVTQVARILNVDRSFIHKRITQFGIEKREYF